MSTMGRRDTRQWAKEELIAAVDARTAELVHDPEADFDEVQAILLQRNRVAHELGFVVKVRSDFPPPD